MKKLTLLFAMLITMVSSAWADEVIIDRSSWSVTAYANPSSAIENAADGRKEAMLDGNASTYFHSDWWTGAGKDATQAFLIDMADEETLTKVTLLPRNNGNGAPLVWRIYVYGSDATPVNLSALTSDNVVSSLSEATLGTPTLSGTWADDATLKTATFTTPVTGRYILFVADERHQATDGQWFCVAEFNAYKSVASTYNVTYDFYVGDKKVATSEAIQVGAGDPYPAIPLPSTMNCSADYYTLSAKPEGTVNSDQTVNITITQNTPFVVSDDFASAKWYTIQNHTDGYYLNYAEGSSMSLNRTSTEYADADQFCFVGNVVEGFRIYNKAAGDGKILSSALSTFDGKTGGNTYAIMTETATAETQAYLWDITKSTFIDGGFYIGQHNNNSGKNRLNRRDGKLAYWNQGADDGSTFVVARVLGSAEYTLLANAIESASASVGTGVGYYPQSAIDAATEVLNNIGSGDEDYVQAKAALEASLIMPVAGKTYQLISANPSFEEQQGHKKAIFDNGTQIRWGQLNAEARAFYWTLTPSDGKYILQNVGTERYPGVQTSYNQAIPSQEAENTVTLASLGQGQFNITSTGCTEAMHTMGHNSGAGVENFVCIWNAGLSSSSAWYIVEAEAPAVDLSALEAAIAKAQSYVGHIGTELGQYQGLTPGELSSGILYAQSFLENTVQTEIDAATALLNEALAKLTLNMPVDGHYYTLQGVVGETTHGNKQYMIGATVSVQKGNQLVQRLVLSAEPEGYNNVFQYVDGKLLSVTANCYVVNNAGFLNLGDADAEGVAIEFTPSTAVGTYLVKFKNGNTDRCTWSRFEGYIDGADYYADREEGYQWNIVESDYVPAANMKITAAQWGTFWAPFAVEIPEGVKAYTGEMKGDWIKMTEVEGVIPANTGVVVTSEQLVDVDLKAVESDAEALQTCYTGNTTGAVMNVEQGAYLLQKNFVEEKGEEVVGWYKVLGEGFTLAPNRCYLAKGIVAEAGAESRTFIGFEPVDGDATGISTIASQAATKADGKYMVKGQIVVVKSGKAYNVNGTQIK